MPGPTSLRWRLLRAAAFSVVATQLAALGHVVGGGGTPDTAVLLIGAGTIGAVGTGLTLVQRRWSSIFGVMALCQLLFHLLFTVDAHAGMSPAMSGAHSFVPADLGRMLAFHLLAAALSALVLARGEAALFGLFAALRRVVGLPLPHIPATAELWIAAFTDLRCPRPSGALLSISPRRGPPVVL